MFEEPYPTIVGETFKITCISTGIYILWRRPRTNVAIIVGGDQHGACNMSGSFDQNFTYFCFPSNYTYIVVIPGAFNDQNGNGTYWTCENLLGGQKQVLHLITCKHKERKNVINELETLQNVYNSLKKKKKNSLFSISSKGSQ